MTQKKEVSTVLQPAEADDGSAAPLSLTLPIDRAAADGKSANKVEAKYSRGGFLLPDASITFEISTGSATFSNGSTKIVGPATDPMGRSDVTFTDTTAESGEIVAWLTSDPNIQSDPVPYTFTGTVAPKNYAFTLSSRTPQGEAADGKAENIGRVVVTENGGRLTEAQIVKFVFKNGAASFDTSQPYVQPLNSTSTVLYVETHFDDQSHCDIADAYFDDAKAETVTLEASLPAYSDLTPQTQDFTFTSVQPTFGLGLASCTPHGEPADGKAKNQGRAVVTENGGALQTAQIVQFEFESGSAAAFDIKQPDVQPGSTPTLLKVQTHSESGQDIADAYFTDSEAESVTLVASLVDHPEVEPETQGFEFVVPPPPPPPPRYKVTITDYPPSIDDQSSAPVSGTVVDTKTDGGVTGRCAVGYGGLLSGPDHVDAANGSFSFSVDGGYLSKGFVISPLTVSYEDGRDRVNISVVPPFAQ